MGYSQEIFAGKGQPIKPENKPSMRFLLVVFAVAFLLSTMNAFS